MVEKQSNGVSPPRESGGAIGLTPIHGRIHCAATADTTEDQNEVDQIAIDQFLDTLAEVVIGIARRREQLD